MEKGSTRLIFTLVSGFEAYSTALRGALVDSSVRRPLLFSSKARRNLRTASIYTKPNSRAATLCGNVPFQCFGCTRPPTHGLVPLHLACTFRSTTAVYLQLKAQNSLR